MLKDLVIIVFVFPILNNRKNFAGDKQSLSVLVQDSALHPAQGSGGTLLPHECQMSIHCCVGRQELMRF